MNVLVFNCGSSSLKYRLVCMPEERELASGEAQRVGPKTAEPPVILHSVNGRREKHAAIMPDHASAFEQIMKLLRRERDMLPDMIAHRVVHGGGIFSHCVLINENTLADLESIKSMAPIHNPPTMNLIHACCERYPDLPQVAVFDTAFHATIPDYARTYALPQELRERLGIRKYGFHGTSHQYVTAEAARFLGKKIEKFSGVSCHLGSGGASLCAVVNGRSVDNTMGYSPLQGLIMSTRCGDLDPAVVLRLLGNTEYDRATVKQILNKNSGVLGLSGLSADIRDVLATVENTTEKDERQARTSEVYLWRIRKYLGAYLTVVGDADAVIFTDTVGELLHEVRWAVCADMDVFGLRIDPERNRTQTKYPADISADDSRVRILVIPTNEELAIARGAYRLLEGVASRKKGKTVK
ncbi:MAG: acetate/propionate family kinase [Planctomycetes bacterium]|nr:acetate/propionate family kinase [Planctomycetota bacterium]